MYRFDYKLDNGIILDPEGNPLEVDEFNRAKVRISDREQMIDVHKIRLYLSNSLTFSPEFIDRIHIHDVDDNVEHQYSPPIESSLPGYFHIPLFRNIVISRNGELRDLSKINWRRKWTRVVGGVRNSKGGYKRLRIYSDILDTTMSHSRHRLLLLTFRLCQTKPSMMVVNHINGIPDDDDLDNLEWATYSKNTRHAYDIGLYYNKTKPVQCLNWLTGEVMNFLHVADCARKLGLKDSLVRKRVESSDGFNRGDIKKYSDGLAFRYSPDDPHSPWILSEKVTMVPRKEFIFAKNIVTEETFVFDTIADAAEFNSIDVKLLDYFINNLHIRPKNMMIYRRESDLPFPKFNVYQKQMAQDSEIGLASGIIVRLEGCEETFYKSRFEYMDKYGLTISQLATLIKNEPDKYIVVKLNKEYLHDL